MKEGAKVFLAATGLIGVGFATWALKRKAEAAPPEPPPEVFVCPYCGDEFATYIELQKHLLEVHPELPPPVTYHLTVLIDGPGMVIPEGGDYPANAVATLTAIPAESARFDHWGIDASGTNPVISITMNSDKVVRATFIMPTPPPPPPVTGTLFGSVVDADTGEGIAGVKVTVSGMEISSDSDGVYYLDLLAGENYSVRFEKEGYYPETRQVYISQSPRLLNVALSPIPPPVAKFYMPPTMEAKIVEIWTMWPYYYKVNYRCEITNQGDVPGTHIITVSNSQPDWLEPWSFSITLAPGETYVWSYSQLAVSPLTFYLDGDWQGNNHSVGVPS